MRDESNGKVWQTRNEETRWEGNGHGRRGDLGMPPLKMSFWHMLSEDKCVIGLPTRSRDNMLDPRFLPKLWKKWEQYFHQPFCDSKTCDLKDAAIYYIFYFLGLYGRKEDVVIQWHDFGSWTIQCMTYNDIQLRTPWHAVTLSHNTTKSY